MKHRIFLLLTLLLATHGTALHAQVALGKWRDHLSYNTLYKVAAAGDRVYCSAAGGMFYYDLDDYTVNRLNKTTSLNDVGIRSFAFDPASHNLVIAYNNSNIDILLDDKVTNISDIKRSNIGADKRVNNIRFDNRKAFLACGFGIVVVDLVRSEIMDTYFLGPDGSYLNINDIAFAGDMIVAATDNGIIYANRNSQNLNLASNWTADSISLLAGSQVTHLESDGTTVFALAVAGDTTLFAGTPTTAFVPVAGGNIRNIKVSNDNLIVCHDNRIDILGTDLAPRFSLGDIEWMKMDPNDAEITPDGRLWIAHAWAALAVVDPHNTASLSIIAPERPADDKAFKLTSFDNDLMVCPGGHTTTYSNAYIAANVYTLGSNGWHTLDDPDHILGNIHDVVDVAVNPRDNKKRLAAAWGSGIVEITANTVTNLFNEDNTGGALSPYRQGDFTSLRTGSIAYDNNGNAWITNSLSQNTLAARMNDGSWKSFNTLSMTSGNEIDHIIWDSVSNLKIFWGRPNKIFIHDGDNRMAYIDPNNGAKLETSMVNCLAQDHNGNIWIGTNKGIKVIYDLQKAFLNGGNGEKSPVTCNNILFNENGISEYLMAYENITCIVVDGANRKWVGTSTGGLYLISSSGLQQVEHFTSANSPLFSDKILSLAVMPWSGELFVATDYGLQSYRSTATYAFDNPMDDIHAFPNPVQPGFDGLIAIKGFTRNALVHITDVNGNTVFATRANGGQAVWNGRTHDGKPVASGVYYVFASALDGSMRSATKILIIR